MKKIIIAVALTIIVVLTVFLLQPTGYASNKNVDNNEKNYVEINETIIEESIIKHTDFLRVL